MNAASTRSWLALLLLALPLGACTTSEKAPESSSLDAVRMSASPDLATAVEDFREARYQASFDRARALARSSSPPLREQAAWVAGLSAYQMNMLDEAELQFMAAARSQDPRLVNDTRIMIADIRVLQKRWNDAARGYREAAQALSGQERSRVLSYAEVAESYASGGSVAAPSPPVGATGAAASSTRSPSSPVSATRGSASSPAPSSFALQAGAFQNERNARRRASDIAPSTRSAGLGEPRVVKTRDGGGREFWTVQVGAFASRQSAESARAKVPSLELIVAAAG